MTLDLDVAPRSQQLHTGAVLSNALARARSFLYGLGRAAQRAAYSYDGAGVQLQDLHAPEAPILSLLQTLPPELLSVIFRLASASTTDRLRLCAVCAHWRASALADASFWAELTTRDLRQPLLIWVALDRSNTAPLCVSLEEDIHRDRYFEGDLLCIQIYASRLRTLKITTHHAFLFPTSLVSAATQLEHLEYENLGQTQMCDVSGPPTLRTLILGGIVVDCSWRAPVLPLLQEFRFNSTVSTDVASGPSLLPTGMLICRILAACPVVEKIAITAELQTDTFAAAATVPRTLREVTLNLCCSHCADSLLRQLGIGAVPTIRVIMRTDAPFCAGTGDQQARPSFTTTLFGFRYRYTHICIFDGVRKLELSDPERRHERSFKQPIPVSLASLSYGEKRLWAALQLSDTLRTLEFPMEAWNEIALLTQGDPLQAPAVRIRVTVSAMEIPHRMQSKSMERLHCTDLAALEIVVLHEPRRSTVVSIMGTRRLLALLDAVEFSSGGAQLTMKRSCDALADESFSERFVRMLRVKRETRWSLVWN